MGIALLSSLTIGRNSSLSLIEFVKKMKQRTLSLVVLSTIFGIVLSSDVTQEKENVEEMEQGRIRLDVYYESLCPDSRMFLINQLGRHYDSIASFVHVRLIPFAKPDLRRKRTAATISTASTELENARATCCTLAGSNTATAQCRASNTPFA